ncbi:MAG TPA: hypothetical protein VMZ28_15375 [Kofleriaceae bacterium]|nr:hypothetical protein [Kofleriaceae bacterium]
MAFPRALTALVATLAGACSFDAGGGSATAPIDAARDDGGAPVVDAAPGTPDAGGDPVACTADGDPCPLTCQQNEDLGGEFCTTPSNIPADIAAACGDTGAALTPAAGDVLVEDVDGIRIRCTISCDGLELATITPVTTVAQPDGAPPLAVFCLSQMNIPSGVTLTVSPGLGAAVALLVHKGVVIDGPVNVDGGAATAGDGLPGSGGGVAGAGGGAGAGLSGLPGNPGAGMCGGSGGDRVGITGDHAAGGGGGGGHGGQGGAGGQGVDLAISTTAAGGDPGGPNCGSDELRPLRGGGGGGGGGDGSCDNTCGWAGGGGGGALQISSRGSMTLSGVIQATGGAGFGETAGQGSNGGGGGGGAGGGILLEAPEIVLAAGAGLVVNGGAGGDAGGGAGGGGAIGSASAGGKGNDGTAARQGGSGGGGGGGRVRMNATVAGECTDDVSPDGICTVGKLRLQLLF